MSDNEKILHIVSNDTKDSIDQISVVTPSIFTSIYTEFAKQHDIELNEEEEISDSILHKEYSNFTTLQDATLKGAIKLSDSASKAISAIQDKNESLLSEVLKETQELRAEVEKLKESVYKDELTNVYNRKWLNDKYLEGKSKTFLESGTLAIVDLNYFKLVNDTHGHVLGDKVLIFIANQLKLSRNEVIRYGGDEFIIIFSDNSSTQKAKRVLDEIREGVISKKLKAPKGLFRTSFSIGVTSYTSGDALTTTIETADKNMYEDKLIIKKRVTGIEV